jgi:hypothetical protein
MKIGIICRYVVSFLLQILYSYDVDMVSKAVWARWRRAKSTPDKNISPRIQPVAISLVTDVGQS